MLGRFDDGELPSGCLATIAVTSEVAGAGPVAERIAHGIAGMHRAFADRCERAREEGELPADADCEALAAMLTATARGIAVLDRSGGRALARQAVDGALGAVGALVARA